MRYWCPNCGVELYLEHVEFEKTTCRCGYAVWIEVCYAAPGGSVEMIAAQQAVEMMDEERIEAVRIGGQWIRREDVKESEEFALLVISHIESVRRITSADADRGGSGVNA